MTRVVLCVQNLPVPQDPRVWREARSLARAGYEVTAISPGAPGQPRRECVDGVDIRRYRAVHNAEGLAGQVVETTVAVVATTFHVLRLRLRGRVDVLHAANPPDTFFLVALLFRPFGTHFVYDQHDACPELLEARMPSRPLLGGLMRLLERISYRSADVVIAANSSYRDLALTRGRCDPASVFVVRSGPDAVADASPAAPDADPARVVFAGVIGRQDGVELLLEAVRVLVRERERPLSVEVIGAGDDLDRLRDRAEALGLGRSVTWTGWLPYPEMMARVAAATVAVSPDEDTAYNRISTMTKITDYLAAGAPVVAADLPENRVTAGDAAVYFQPGDAADLAARLEVVLADARHRDQLRQRARARARELLWQRSEATLVAAYESIRCPRAAPVPAVRA